MRGELLEAELVHDIVGAFFTVYNYFGCGLSEGVYADALEIELQDRGHKVVRELRVPITYKRRHVRWQRIDFVVDDKVIVENKAGPVLLQRDHDQTITYIRVTTFEVGLLLHFGPSPKFYRYIDWPKRKKFA
jgi:GxxExxY protein